MKKLKELILGHKNLSIALFCLLCIAVVWLVPFQNRQVVVDIYTQSEIEGTQLSVEMYNPEAFEPCAKIQTVAENGMISFNIDYEYVESQRISLVSDVTIQTEKMTVYSSYIDYKDYKAFEYSGDILYDENGLQSLTPQALDAIDNALNNVNYLRIVLTAIVVFAAFLFVLANCLVPKFGKFKAATVCLVLLLSVSLLAWFKIDGDSTAVINLLSFQISNGIIVALIVAFFDVLIIAALLSSENTKSAKCIIAVIYVSMLLFSGFKMLFYAEKVARTPDEAAHIGYVAYLEENDCIVPDFAEMEMIAQIEQTDSSMVFTFASGTVSYLGHPPLYYHLMKLTNTVSVSDDGMIYVNITEMRLYSMALALIALALIFYIGYSRIEKKPILHLLYATCATSVPMMLYGASGISNDSLCLLTVTATVLGLLRYSENKRNFGTYFLIALGIFATLMTKLTAGIMVALAGVIVFVASMIKQKSVKELIGWRFLCTLPLYLIPVAYYLLMYKEYGGFVVSILKLDPEYAHESVFYVDIGKRTSMGIIEYFHYYRECFFKSWTSVWSHFAFLKTDESWFSVQNIALITLWFAPLALLFKKVREKTPYSGLLLAGYAGIIATFVMQAVNGYQGFCTRGYTGGFQSRYYICAICIFALALAKLFEMAFNAFNREERYAQFLHKALNIAAIAFIGLLAYEDFIYFVAYFNDYIVF